MATKNFHLSTGKTMRVGFETPRKNYFIVALEIDNRRVIYEGDSFGEAMQVYKSECEHYAERQRNADAEAREQMRRLAEPPPQNPPQQTPPRRESVRIRGPAV